MGLTKKSVLTKCGSVGEGLSKLTSKPSFSRDAKKEKTSAATAHRLTAAVEAVPSTAEAVSSASCDEVFSWLHWSPPVGTPCKTTLDRCFPGALPGHAVLKRTAQSLKDNFGMTPSNTMYGDSICPDEINHEPGGLASLMSDHWGEVFPMGGIGGAPFVGKTGFAAFSHHVPDDGHVLILFGPHVGVSEAGVVGKYCRKGQSCDSSACGAVLSAYCQVCDDAKSAKVLDVDDMQQSWLRQSICSRVGEIKMDPEPLAKVTEVAFDMIKEHLLRIVDHSFGKGKLVLVGGVQINLPAPYDDHFQPKFFQAFDESMQGEDLLSELSFAASRLAKSIPSVGFAPLQEDAVEAVEAKEPPLLMTVKVPDTMPDDWRGVPLQVRTPSGGTIAVQIPPGMRAGDTFRIPVPDSDKDGLLDGEAKRESGDTDAEVALVHGPSGDCCADSACCETAARPEQVSEDAKVSEVYEARLARARMDKAEREA